MGFTSFKAPQPALISPIDAAGIGFDVPPGLGAITYKAPKSVSVAMDGVLVC